MAKVPVFISNELESEENPRYIVSRLIELLEVPDEEVQQQPEEQPRYIASQSSNNEKGTEKATEKASGAGGTTSNDCKSS
jgi:hypothetical protein